MLNCPKCTYPNPDGTEICEACGTPLPVPNKTITQVLKITKSITGEGAQPIKMVKSDQVPNDAIISFSISGADSPIIIVPKPNKGILLGRADQGAKPDIDLTVYAGYRMGVSRRHVEVRKSKDDEIEVIDLGSSNGTFLQGEKLSPHKPYPLHDGDEIMLGQLRIRISFPKDLPAVMLSAPTMPQPISVTAGEDEPKPHTKILGPTGVELLTSGGDKFDSTETAKIVYAPKPTTKNLDPGKVEEIKPETDKPKKLSDILKKD